MLSMKDAVGKSREEHLTEVASRAALMDNEHVKSPPSRYKTKLLDEFSQQVQCGGWLAWVCPF